MSPIPSVATALALSSVVSPVALDPNAAGHSASVMSQHALGTGGFLFAMVALVSVVGYFYHGRGAANCVQEGKSWASLTGLLSFIRLRGSATTSTAVATDWAVDLEADFKDVSMVYARFFHPTSWNLVEYHPATPSALAIYVEDESNDIPTSDAKQPGINSFLDMDDDDDGTEDDSRKRALEKPVQDGKSSVKALPPYDTSSPININFNSKIIGTTMRSGAFLSVPDELEVGSPEDLSCDTELVSSYSPYGGILPTIYESEPPCLSYDGIPSELDFPSLPYDVVMSTASELEFSCSPYDGIVTAASESDTACLPYDWILPATSESEFSCSPYDGIATTDSESDFPSLPYDGVSPDASKPEFSRSLYDGIVTTDSESELPYLAYYRVSPSASESEFSCSPFDGVVAVIPESDFSSLPCDGVLSAACDFKFASSPYDGVVTVAPESDTSQLPFDGTMTPPRSSPSTRRYGMADMGHLAQSLKDTIPGGVHGSKATVSRRTGLSDLASFTEIESILSCARPVDDAPTIPGHNVSVQGDCDSLGNNPGNTDIVLAPREGQDLMRRLLAELRDPNMDCTPRPLSEDSDSEYHSDDDGDGGGGDEADAPCLTPTRSLQSLRQNLLELASSPGTDSDVSDDGTIFPLTPPSKPVAPLTSTPDVVWSPIVPRFNQEAMVMSPTSLDSPLPFPSKAYVRSRRDCRSLVYGPPVPLANLPCL